MSQINELTTKDLSYLRDELSWVLLAAKKCYRYERETQDPGLKRLYHDLGQQHQAQYERLHQHLERQSFQTASSPQGQMQQGQFGPQPSQTQQSMQQYQSFPGPSARRP